MAKHQKANEELRTDVESATGAAAPGEPTAEDIAEYEEIARLAYSYWEARGRQGGPSEAEADWFRASEEVRKRKGGSNTARARA